MTCLSCSYADGYNNGLCPCICHDNRPVLCWQCYLPPGQCLHVLVVDGILYIPEGLNKL